MWILRYALIDVVEESQRRLEPINRRCDASVFKFPVHHHVG